MISSRACLAVLLWLTIGLGLSQAQDPGDAVLFRGVPGARVIDEPDIRVGGIPVLTAGGGGTSPELAPARLATTGSILLSGEQTIDGVLTASSAVVVWQQTTPSQNGLYLSSSGGWTRRTDLDVSAEFAGHKSVYVTSGVMHGGKVFRIANTGTVTLGTTAITLVPEPASWHVPVVQSLSEGDTIACNPPAGQFAGVMAQVVGTGGPVGLGVQQIVDGTRSNQLCLLEGMSDTNTVELSDGSGVLLSSEATSVILTTRTSVLLRWTGAVWRQVAGGAGGTGTATTTLQDACDNGATCGFTNLTQARPFTLRGTPTGPYELIYELGGNFVRQRRNGDGSLAGPEVIRLEADHLLSVQALLGTPTPSWQDVATIENVGGVSIATTGLFAVAQTHIAQETGAHAATAIGFTPTSEVSATNVQTAIEQVRSVIGGGTITGLLNLQRTSPAANAGICLASVTVDLAGTARPQQSQCDMGAYEVRPAQVGPSIPLSMGQGSPNNAATTYLGVTASGTASTTTTNAHTWPTGGTFDRLICQVTTAPGAGKSWAMRLRVNAVDTALTCTISDTAVQCEDVVAIVNVVRGGSVGYSLLPTATPTAPATLSCGVMFTGS